MMTLPPKTILDSVRKALESRQSRADTTERVAELIRSAGGYRWVGIYDVDAEEIAVVAWTGPGRPANPRFPVSQGLCGAAVRSKSSVIVPDVTKDRRYLTTFGTTRSEIVVPVIHSATGAVLGVVDVESERLNAFTDDDRVLLEQCASVLPSLWE